MRKVAIVFIVAVLLPSMVLAWLAVRSLRHQQLILERQQALLYQGVTDSAAIQVQSMVEQHRQDFNAHVEELLKTESPAELAGSFDERIRSRWPMARVGFAVSEGGDILSPHPNSRRTESRAFRGDNGAFLGSREIAEVYFGNINGNAFMVQNAQHNENSNPSSPRFNSSFNSASQDRGVAQKTAPSQRVLSPKKSEPARLNESRQQAEAETVGEPSRLVAAEAGFKELIGAAMEGNLARFVDNKLNVLFWYRSPRDNSVVFGAQLDLHGLQDQLRDALPGWNPELRGELCIAVLDDLAKPVSLSHPDFQGDWKHPFVATEIGEFLPHWETAAYLLNPNHLNKTARTAKLTLGLLIAILVIAIGTGGALIVLDLNRELRLARQKTDFVSNVSHELKTPLTSIRMFSELLSDGRTLNPEKQRSYLNIINAETARLTRLINNVLDFSRIDRGEKKYNIRDCDLAEIVRASCESYRPHLENHGFSLECSLPENGVPVRGDCDALAQVILNLLSNAEKYSLDRKEISIHLKHDASRHEAQLTISDRGVGVAKGDRERIFEKFYRTHDSLSSGIQGSGLGLTLARQIARAHGGDVTCHEREGGGSIFMLNLPSANRLETSQANT